MANRERLIVALVVLFGGLTVSGCGPSAAEQSLLDAVRRKDTEMVKKILGESPKLANAKDKMGETALRRAARSRSNEVAELLIANGASVNARGSNALSPGGTPLHNAVIWGNTEVVELLLANGADVNARDKNGQTALYNAMSVRAALDNPESQMEVVKLLIKNGADANIVPRKGSRQGPLHRAAMMGWCEVAELLIANGAEVNARDGDDRTPLFWARGPDRKEIADLLRKHGAVE